MESDVGAGVSIISQETYNRHSKETPLQPSNTCLQTYTRHCVKMFGQFLVQFKYQNHNVTVPLLVVKGLRPSLFGRNWLSRIKLDWKPICSIRVSGAGLPHDVKTQLHTSIQCHAGGITAKLEKKPGAEPKFCKEAQYLMLSRKQMRPNITNLNPRVLWKRSNSASGQPLWFMSQRLMAQRGCVETLLLLSTPNSTFLSIQFPCLTMSLSSCKEENDSSSLI